MENRGYVVETLENNIAKMKMQKHSACSSCGKCAHSQDQKDIIVDVYNEVGAQVGDYVEVNLDSVNVLKAVGIAYVIPLISLLVGTISTYFVLTNMGINQNVEVISGIVGLLLTVISYIWIRKNDNRFRESKSYIPVIIKLIEKGATN